MDSDPPLSRASRRDFIIAFLVAYFKFYGGRDK